MPITVNKEPKAQKGWRDRLMRSGYLIGAILLHLVIFLLVATIVIWRAPQPPATSAEFKPTSVKIPPPPPQPPASGASASNPDMDLTAVTVPVVTPPSVIALAAPSTFILDSANTPISSLSHAVDRMATGSGRAAAGGGKGSGNGNGSGFGSPTGSLAQFTGYFYDMKQTPAKTPTGLEGPAYLSLLAKYVDSGFDESLLAPYYRSKSPLYTGAYAISTRDSEEAPKAFGLENEVQPGLWIVHYHAKVQTMEAGNYRLIGFGDNVLVVKVRGEIVLDGGWDSITTKAIYHQPMPYVIPSYVASTSDVHDPHLKSGPVFHVDAVEPVDMDVLIGDYGGVCSFFLFVEKVGENYEKDADGFVKYPFFQLESKVPPTFSSSEEHPPYSATSEPWQEVNP